MKKKDWLQTIVEKERKGQDMQRGLLCTNHRGIEEDIWWIFSD